MGKVGGIFDAAEQSKARHAMRRAPVHIWGDVAALFREELSVKIGVDVAGKGQRAVVHGKDDGNGEADNGGTQHNPVDGDRTAFAVFEFFQEADHGGPL